MNPEHNPLRLKTVVYTFDFTSAKKIRYILRFDPDTLEYVPKADRILPDWTLLECCKCPHCPLDPVYHKHCPVAANMSDLSEIFEGMKSHVEVDVTVENSERKVVKHTTVQVGASSLIGLIMATSGCPILDRLRPMAATHSPFSTPEEVSYRIITMYLLAQYFRRKNKLEPDWDLHGLTGFLEETQSVNQHLCKRLNVNRTNRKTAAADSDVLLNAVNILNTSGALTELSIEEDDLDSWKKLYSIGRQI
jgi:hypothetical protein